MSELNLKNIAPLRRIPFSLIPTGGIKPEGWLNDQLTIQKDGLTGHLEDIWSCVGQYSGWLGGTGESWERGPYYLDGLVPLAFQLEDAELIGKIGKWIDWTLESQDRFGWYGPEKNEDWWPQMVMNKVLIQYHEATGDKRIVPFLSRYFTFQLKALPDRPLKNWGSSRAGDNIYAVIWLYNVTREGWLLDLAALINEQSFDWRSYFQNIPFTRPTGFYYDWKRMKKMASFEIYDAMAYFSTHTVNIAMGVKTPVLVSQLRDDGDLVSSVDKGIDDLMTHHGLAMGIWSGDEHLNGDSPSKGAELCSVTELLFSLEENLKVTGDPATGDHIEKLAYNALPGTMGYRIESHQYDQMPNQIAAVVAEHGFYNNDDDANIFGLEPNFGCCLANMHQGWPKFVSHMFMESYDGGLALMLYGPSATEFETKDGKKVRVVQKTEYPFSDRVEISVSSEAEVAFPLHFRIPGWCDDAKLEFQGETFAPETGTVFKLDYKGSDENTLVLRLPMTVKTSFWGGSSVAVERGPLLYALKIDEEWTVSSGTKPYCDYAVRGLSEWKYALELTEEGGLETYEVIETGIASDQPYSQDGAPVRIMAKAHRCPEWGKEKDTALLPPTSPLPLSGENEMIELVPYAATKLRITCFPWGHS